MSYRAISKASLQVLHEIGSGTFGTVRLGICEGVPVAIKTRNPSNTTKEAFLYEAFLMSNLHHQNLVEFYGVVLEDPTYIVMEFMSNGNLSEYLQSEQGRSSELSDQVCMAVQIASGMSYLHNMGCIHRDLRARNVLVGENLVCKVADFGLTRLTNGSEYQASRNSTFYAIWTAPEAKSRGIFNLKSDVWSFGCLMFEIVTKGHVPTRDINKSEALLKGVSIYLRRIMNDCCCVEPSERPTFKCLENRLTELYRHLEDQKYNAFWRSSLQ